MHKPNKQNPAETLSEEDQKLFREAVGGTNPLVDSGRHYLQPKAPKPVRRPQTPNHNELLDELSSTPADSEDQTYFLRAGLQQRVLRKLRRGQHHIEDHIDLHNLNQQEASKLIAEFIDFANNHRLHCVKIIHGKGLGSGKQKPVLTTLTRNILRRHPGVLAFTPASNSDGGSGAVWVLLKTNK